MKERIYSIPLSENLETKCGCVLCNLEEQLENDSVKYFLGDSLMEPDTRLLTNEKGFCRRHFKKLLEGSNRLGLALILETHIPELKKKTELLKKGGIFSSQTDFTKSALKIQEQVKECAFCERLDKEIKEAASNLVYMWGEEEDFRRKFEASDGLCLEHFGLVLSVCEKELPKNKLKEFEKMLVESEKKKCDELYNDLHEFTLSFDYRNNNKTPGKNATESVEKAIKYLAKY